MRLGESISRMLVPHPILSQPTRVQILYTAYRGWLSSGLTQWKMDKVTLMDSFGKMSSVCKKNLVLDSGVPVTLPLYPGECNLPLDSEEPKEAEDRMQDLSKNSSVPKEGDFKPTPVVKIGLEDNLNKERRKPSLSVQDALGLLNLPWRSDKENNIEELETESSRAFNTRIVKTAKESDNEEIREIVEPILKPQSTKNARSHNPDKEKPEITEPILGPTTSKTFAGFKLDPVVKNDFLTKITKQSKELNYNFYDRDSDEWIPSVPRLMDNKRKREDETKVFAGFDITTEGNPLEAFVSTVQFLPQRLARMFEQAEKYARDTILPLVSTYTPKFITEIINPKEQKYVPLLYDEPTTPLVKQKIKLNLPPGMKLENDELDKDATTPYTHIQKIKRKTDMTIIVPPIPKEKIIPISMEPPSSTTTRTTSTTTTRTTSTTTAKVTTIKKIVKKEEKVEVKPEPKAQALISGEVTSRKARDEVHVIKNVEKTTEKATTTTKKTKAIYIDLPVFIEPESKYIPLTYKGN